MANTTSNEIPPEIACHWTNSRKRTPCTDHTKVDHTAAKFELVAASEDAVGDTLSAYQRIEDPRWLLVEIELEAQEELAEPLSGDEAPIPSSVALTPDSIAELVRREPPQRWSKPGASVAFSNSTYYTALSRLGRTGTRIVRKELQESDEYAQLLRTQKLWHVDPMVEQNWSERGQHAKFEKCKQSLINSILEVQDDLGSTHTDTVQSVRCRRILLARKTITCGKHAMTKEEAVKEVAHLTHLNHAHILRVIGTYVKTRHLSILLYSVADYNLDEFPEVARKGTTSYDCWHFNHISTLRQMFVCLSSAVEYIHRNLTKHMDIKPQNVPVRETHVNKANHYLIESTSQTSALHGRTILGRQ